MTCEVSTTGAFPSPPSLFCPPPSLPLFWCRCRSLARLIMIQVHRFGGLFHLEPGRLVDELGAVNLAQRGDPDRGLDPRSRDGRRRDPHCLGEPRRDPPRPARLARCRTLLDELLLLDKLDVRERLGRELDRLVEAVLAAVTDFITDDKVNVQGLVLAGSADFKTELSQSDMFDQRLWMSFFSWTNLTFESDSAASSIAWLKPFSPP
jgi:hypothetical protein